MEEKTVLGEFEAALSLLPKGGGASPAPGLPTPNRMALGKSFHLLKPQFSLQHSGVRGGSNEAVYSLRGSVGPQLLRSTSSSGDMEAQRGEVPARERRNCDLKPVLCVVPKGRVVLSTVDWWTSKVRVPNQLSLRSRKRVNYRPLTGRGRCAGLLPLSCGRLQLFQEDGACSHL